jgi:hypothetical protein
VTARRTTRQTASAYDGLMQATAERVEANEAIFAEANDAIAVVAGTLAPRDVVPFLCECPSPRCSEIAEVALGEYAALRLFANRFLIAASCRSGDLAGTLIVERTERFSIVDRLAF